LEIITDTTILSNKSEEVDLDSGYRNVLGGLVGMFERNTLGLAAPQLGIMQRMFVALLYNKTVPSLYGFVNPRFERKGKKEVPSTEACLSIPDVTRTVLRHNYIEVNFDKCFQISDEGQWEEVEGPMQLSARDAFVFQHEYDHLEGTLLTDHTDIGNPVEWWAKQALKKRQKIKQRQKNAPKNLTKPDKVNPKKQAQLRKMEKARRKKNRMLAKRKAQLEFMEKESSA